jgi:RHS repeat-associated protein
LEGAKARRKLFVSTSTYQKSTMFFTGNCKETYGSAPKNYIDAYRFGFNGKEQDPEFKGKHNVQDYGFRMNDTRYGRFFSVDPLRASYPELSCYQYSSNSPISSIDLDGLEGQWISGAWNFTKNTVIEIWDDTKATATSAATLTSYAVSQTANIPNYALNKQGTGSYYDFSQGKWVDINADAYDMGKKNGQQVGNSIYTAAVTAPLAEVGGAAAGKLIGKAGNTVKPILSKGFTKMANSIAARKCIAQFEKAAAKGEITALGLGKGNWGKMKKDGLLSGYNVLEADVKLDWKNAADRDWFWENVNKPALDKIIDKGGTFKLFDSPTKENMLYKGTEIIDENLNFFGKEIEYLKKRGYEIVDDIAKPKAKK